MNKQIYRTNIRQLIKRKLKPISTCIVSFSKQCTVAVSMSQCNAHIRRTYPLKSGDIWFVAHLTFGLPRGRLNVTSTPLVFRGNFPGKLLFAVCITEFFCQWLTHVTHKRSTTRGLGWTTRMPCDR